jgi:uncharacterized protein YbcC (UPF0753/DUF2309 family)
MQSLHGGRCWVHEPTHLSGLIEAPEAPIDGFIARHDSVRELADDDGWLHLLRIGEDAVHRLLPGGGLQPTDTAVATAA